MAGREQQVDQRQRRQRAERHVRRSAIRFYVCMSMLRTCVVHIIPNAGSAAWWFIPVILLPGILMTLLGKLLMKREGARTLAEMLQKMLKPTAANVSIVILCMVILYDAWKSLSLLVMLFTDGIGTIGTAWEIALITCIFAFICIRGDGLPRAIHMQRWVFAGFGLVMILTASRKLQLDHLFPVLGNGGAALASVARANAAVSWPMVLLLMEEPVDKKSIHPRELIHPFCVISIACMAIVWMIPHTILTSVANEIDALLLVFSVMPSALKTLSLCMLMLVLFLMFAYGVKMVLTQITQICRCGKRGRKL